MKRRVIGSVFSDNQGDRLTWRILTEDTQKITISSGVRSALRTTTNQCLASTSGEGTTLPFPIPYPQQSTKSLPLDPLDDIKFKLKINKDQAEEIMSYNQLMDYIQK